MLDTSERAAAVHAEIHERLGGAGRLSLALELSDLARSLARAGLAARHPHGVRAKVDEALRSPLP